MYFYFRKYLLLVVLGCMGLVVATVECSRVDSNETRKRKTVKLLENIDNPGSYYQFKIGMYPDRAQTDFLKGMDKFKQSQNNLRQANEAKQNNDQAAQTQHRQEALKLLKEARTDFESALDRGMISKQDLHDFYAITLKSLHDQGEATEQEVKQAVENRRKHFPLSEMPPQLEGY